MLTYEYLNKHWFMYHKLEDDFLEIEKTIPVDSENSNTFSYAYIKLLGSICNELNECFRNLAKLKKLNNNSINQHKEFINTTFSDFIHQTIIFNKLGCESLRLKPFKNWNGDNNLFWWEINNNIKHSRNKINEIEEKENYKLANQKNVLNALSGLFQLNIYFHTAVEESFTHYVLLLPPNPSKIFRFEYQ